MAYRDVVLALSPVAYWRLGEASGSVAADEVGAFPGTYINGPTLGVAGALAGDANTAMGPGGTSGLRITGGVGILSQWSFLMWMNGDPTGDYHFALSTPTYYIAIAHMEDDEFDIFMNGIWTTGIATLAPADGWTLMTFTFDGTNLRVYKDAALVYGPTAGVGVGLPATTFDFGQDSGGSGTQTPMDEIAVWSRALSPAEILSVFEAGTIIPVPPNSIPQRTLDRSWVRRALVSPPPFGRSLPAVWKETEVTFSRRATSEDEHGGFKGETVVDFLTIYCHVEEQEGAQLVSDEGMLALGPIVRRRYDIICPIPDDVSTVPKRGQIARFLDPIGRAISVPIERVGVPEGLADHLELVSEELD